MSTLCLIAAIVLVGIAGLLALFKDDLGDYDAIAFTIWSLFFFYLSFIVPNDFTIRRP